MQYPLIDRQLFSDLRLAHGIYNSIVMLLFLYQGRLGFRIRRDRLAGAPPPFPAINRHRKTGLALTLMVGLGFFAGLTLVLLDTGNVLEYHLHFITGLSIIVLLIATFNISRDIKGPDSPFRASHFALGVAILFLYLVNVFFGIGILV